MRNRHITERKRNNFKRFIQDRHFDNRSRCFYDLVGIWHHSELGWVHCELSTTTVSITQSPLFIRKRRCSTTPSSLADLFCHIHAFGNNFTHCNQVSEEGIVSHFQEYRAAIKTDVPTQHSEHRGFRR
ncbi:MAG: hypothetical protein M2R45_03448 [Verrucomicrobia subdivision 3 bacterium]|nr:hypothetical protein [Limisphaerales bacterium]MCS1415734.1 hypothetical protein [Limisphaerales bacterium]